VFVLGNFLEALARILDVALTIMYWLILIRALISWVNPDPYNFIVQFLHKATEPILYPIRKLLPFTFKLAIDISPIIAFLIIMFLRISLLRTLYDLAYRLRPAL
jgi:YggT family protein